jgi:hypothetical protein
MAAKETYRVHQGFTDQFVHLGNNSGKQDAVCSRKDVKVQLVYKLKNMSVSRAALNHF